MTAYELILHERPTRSPKGQFLKGNVPANKGKKWDEYMPKSSQRRAKKGWKNLVKYSAKGAAAGRNKRAVVAITEDYIFVARFESIVAAARASGAQKRNIGLCCSGKAVETTVFCKKNGKRYNAVCVRRFAGKTADGRRLRWFYEDDDRWVELIIKKHLEEN
jgi:hypothetical protein